MQEYDRVLFVLFCEFMMITHSHSMNNSSSNTRTTLNGKEIGEEDSSSISTMSSVDIGSRQEILEASDYDVKIEGKLMTESQIVNVEETSKNSETDSSPHMIEEDEGNGDTKLSNSSSNPSDSDVWSLFDDSDEYPELVDEMAVTHEKIPHEPSLVDSHDTSHFIEASTQKLVDQGNSFMMPRPDSFGNFSPSKTPESSQCKLSEEEITDLKSSATILSSKYGDSTPSKGEELLSLGADILMEKSLLTGKLTLEDPSQSTENEDSASRPSSSVSTTNNPFKPSLKLLVTSFLMISGSTSGIFYFAKKSSYWEQSALELKDEIELLRKDLEVRENQLKDFEERERVHLGQIANATIFCEKEVKEMQSFSWEEKSTPNIFSIDNCWLNAQASFELGLCPQRYLKQVLNTLGFGDSFDNFMNEDYGENDKEEDEEYDDENDVNEYDISGMMNSIFSSYIPRDFVNKPKASDPPKTPIVDQEEDSPITNTEKGSLLSYSTYPYIQEASVAHASWNIIENIGDIAKEFVDAVLLPNDPKKILDGSIWEDVIHKDTEEKN